MQNATKTREAKRKKIAVKFVKAFDDNDADAALTYMAKKPVWEFAVGKNPYGGKYVGASAIHKAMTDTFNANPKISYKTLRAYASGNTVIHEIEVKCRATKMNLHALDIFTFNAADQITSKRTYRKIVTKA